jgi:hypothetical protein
VQLRTKECVSPLYPCSGYRICRVRKDEYVISAGGESITIKEPERLVEMFSPFGTVFCGSQNTKDCVLVTTDCKLYTEAYADPAVGLSGSGRALVFDGKGLTEAVDAVVMTVKSLRAGRSFATLAELKGGKSLAIVKTTDVPALMIPLRGRASEYIQHLRGAVLEEIIVKSIDNVYVKASIPDKQEGRTLVIAFTGWPADVRIADKNSKAPVKLGRGTVEVDFSDLENEKVAIIGKPTSRLRVWRLNVGWYLAELRDGYLVMTDGKDYVSVKIPENIVSLSVSEVGVFRYSRCSKYGIDGKAKKLDGREVALITTSFAVIGKSDSTVSCAVPFDSLRDAVCIDNTYLELCVEAYDEPIRTRTVLVYGEGLPTAMSVDLPRPLNNVYVPVYAELTESNSVKVLFARKQSAYPSDAVGLDRLVVGSVDFGLVKLFWLGSGRMIVVQGDNVVAELPNDELSVGRIGDFSNTLLLLRTKAKECRVEPVTIFAYKVGNKLGTPYELPELLKECCEKYKCKIRKPNATFDQYLYDDRLKGFVPYSVVSEMKPPKDTASLVPD